MCVWFFFFFFSPDCYLNTHSKKMLLGRKIQKKTHLFFWGTFGSFIMAHTSLWKVKLKTASFAYRNTTLSCWLKIILNLFWMCLWWIISYLQRLLAEELEWVWTSFRRSDRYRIMVPLPKNLHISFFCGTGIPQGISLNCILNICPKWSQCHVFQVLVKGKYLQ